MNRKYRKGTKLKYIGDGNGWFGTKFEYGKTYTLGPAKSYGSYSFEEIEGYNDFDGHFIEEPKNFKLNGIRKWKKFIEKGKVF